MGTSEYTTNTPYIDFFMLFKQTGLRESIARTTVLISELTRKLCKYY